MSAGWIPLNSTRHASLLWRAVGMRSTHEAACSLPLLACVDELGCLLLLEPRLSAGGFQAYGFAPAAAAVWAGGNAS